MCHNNNKNSINPKYLWYSPLGVLFKKVKMKYNNTVIELVEGQANKIKKFWLKNAPEYKATIESKNFTSIGLFYGIVEGKFVITEYLPVVPEIKIINLPIKPKTKNRDLCEAYELGYKDALDSIERKLKELNTYLEGLKTLR